MSSVSLSSKRAECSSSLALYVLINEVVNTIKSTFGLLLFNVVISNVGYAEEKLRRVDVSTYLASFNITTFMVELED